MRRVLLALLWLALLVFVTFLTIVVFGACLALTIALGGNWAPFIQNLQEKFVPRLWEGVSTVPIWLIVATSAVIVAAVFAWLGNWLRRPIPGARHEADRRSRSVPNAENDEASNARTRTSARALTIALLAVPGVLVVAGWLDHLGIGHFWLTCTAIAPGFLIFQHGLYLFTIKPRIIRPKPEGGESVSRETTRESQANATESDAADEGTVSRGDGGETASSGPERSTVTESPATTGTGPRGAIREENLQKVQESAEVEFGLQRISLDFFFPALFATFAGLVPAYLLVHRDVVALSFDDEIYTGLLFGTIGGYVYVVMSLGDRTFQRDITTGIATWCGIQLLLGPLLGALAAAAVSTSTQMTEFTREAIYFFAGLAPREMVGFIQSAVRRAFAPDRAALKVKQIPLQTIRGIDQRIEARLMEEGIDDGYMLAMADPVRLYRNTPYDSRQLIAWIDECLLYVFVPDHADLLQKLGISGAIDLAYYWSMNEGNTPAMDRITKIAKDIKFESTAFAELVRRMSEDPQIELIWTLYYTLKDS